jgi:DNA-binding NarL/FixJ family response regulator
VVARLCWEAPGIPLGRNSILNYASAQFGTLCARLPGRSFFPVADGQTAQLNAVDAARRMSGKRDPSAGLRRCRIRLKVSLVEDEKDFRTLLTHALSRAPALECLAAYPTAEAALEDIPRRKPDVVLMDIKLPGMNGIECTRRLLQKLPDLSVVMLTEYEDSDLVFDALKAGAIGYLLRRHAMPEKIHEALLEVMAGGSPMTPYIARKVVRHFQADSAELQKLSPREWEVLEGLAHGWEYKQIAGRLGISLDTTRDHIRSIYRKLDVHSRSAAIVKYLGK